MLDDSLHLTYAFLVLFLQATAILLGSLLQTQPIRAAFGISTCGADVRTLVPRLRFWLCPEMEKRNPTTNT